MNELVDHWIFFEPDWYLTMLGKECLSRDILEIFFIARSIFSSKSLYPTKDRLLSLLIREKPASSCVNQECPGESRRRKEPMSDHVTIAKISSIGQIASILPREFITSGNDLIFYKKLVNRELNRREFESPEENILSVSELVHGRDQEVNRAQKVYVLFDNSSSMSGEKFNKFYASKAITLEYLRQVQPENPQIYFRSFTDRVSPLIRSEKAKDIKKIIKHVANLHTEDCHQTEIGKAVLRAIEDIRSDPRMKKAEILVITDGLGPIPKDLKDVLGQIKLHVILICGVNIEQMLNLYPDRSAWDRAGSENTPRKMPAFWDIYGRDDMPLSLPDPSDNLEAIRKSRLTPSGNQMLRKMEILLALAQIYQLQEVVDTFISLPSMLGEKFNIFNPAELALIVEYRKKLEDVQYQDLSTNRKSEIYQRVQFMLKYLNHILSRKIPKEAQSMIKLEIDNFDRLRQAFLKDPWLVSTMSSLADLGEHMEKREQREEKPLETAERVLSQRTGNRKVDLVTLVLRIKKTLRCSVRRCLPLKNFRNYGSTLSKKRRLNRLTNKMQDALNNTLMR